MARRSGERLVPSKGVENEYYDSLRPFADAMCRTVRSAVKRSTMRYVRPRVLATWDASSKELATAFAERVVSYSMYAFRRSVTDYRRQGVHIDVLRDPKARREVARIVRENAKLIRSIPRLYLSKVNAAILSYNEGNLTQSKFDERMDELERQVFTRMRLIARDQNDKATEAMLILRMDANGLRLVKWCHTHLPEKKPRDYHLRRWDGHSGKRNGRPNGLNGYIFDISKPPVIDLETGERGYPAQLINCRCYLVPVFENDQGVET